jgi:uncharacterized pyridoxal phosphate-dependent enzyme
MPQLWRGTGGAAAPPCREAREIPGVHAADLQAAGLRRGDAADVSIHEQYGLTPVINARGTFTPLGVSRSSEQVRRMVAQALGDFFIIDEVQSVLSQALAQTTGAEAGTLTHCAAAGITLSVAAAMTGSDEARIAALPDAAGMPDRVVLPAAHAVDYGHPILTDIRLAGATPVLAGSSLSCSIPDLEAAMAHERTACLLLVSSRLVSGRPLDLKAAVAAAHRRGVPAVIDAAAQDLRIQEVLATGADIVVLSGQKYLASPTAGGTWFMPAVRRNAASGAP